MSGYNVASLARLIECFERMPGIGHKTAQRMAFYVLGMKKQEAQAFAEAIVNAHEKIKKCVRCCNLSEEELCPICQNGGRDESTICVVEDPRDVIAFERTHEYEGTYHVLHGVISPMNGVGPEDITVKELIARMGDGKVKEVIMATNPTVEGEATAMYIGRLLKPMGVTVTRLAYGVPVGADLEYADEVTLSKALEGRRSI
ncbi:MAG: recombination mediator RecR [Oscillospiraceae bacterium]|nr:recombination mediator RecR [Oscillospiraceae bacterium]MDD6146704.1 recombination mediator RecR [Oscillospiraceae bacterium]